MIYYCVPTHNEEKTVGVVLWKIRHVMAELPRDYQILVGDDASTDGSARALDPYRRVLPVVLMRNAERKGYAATLEMLLRQAVRMSRYPKRDVIVVLQADFTDDIDGAASMLRRIESGADIAAGGPVTDSVRPGLFERLARGYASRLMRRFEWPEHADPLNGLNVYRLMCIKRAIEEADGKRILPWDGAAANAALLRAALPHARRVESVEINRYAERAQRHRRFRPLEMVGHVRRFAAGSMPADLQAVETLDPDEVRGDLSVLHGPAANGHDTRNEDSGKRSRRRNGKTRSADGAPARRRSPRASQRDDRAAQDSTTEGRAGAGKPPSRRKSTSTRARKSKADVPSDAPVPSADASVADATVADAGNGTEATDSPKTGRSRRGRRRGGRRRRSPDKSAAAHNVSGSEDTPASPDGAGSTPEAITAGTGSGSPGDGQVAVTEGDKTRPSARRRRGRRGGRNRRGSRRPSGTNDASNESGNVPDVNPQAEGSG